MEEEDKKQSDTGSDPPRPHVLVVSAKDDISLQRNKMEILRHLANLNVRVDLDDLAYTLSARRTHHSHRACAVVTSSTLNQAEFVDGKRFLQKARIGYVFTGQGSQWPQMGRTLVRTFPEAARCVKHLDGVLQSLSSPPGWSLLGVYAYVHLPV
jgi:acyl transferase domain-containing protein